MGGGRFREVVALGGSTVVYFISIFLLFEHIFVYFSSNLFLEVTKLVNCERLLRLPL